MTNEIPAANNTWTLMKHVAGSVNKGASKIDQGIYGKIEKHSNTTVIIQQARPIPEQKDTNIFTVIGMFVVGMFLVFVLVAWLADKIETKDLLWPP